MEFRIQELARLLEEEIAHYEKLVGALQKEADDLRQGSAEDLLKSVKTLSEHAEAISQIHQDARRKIEDILHFAGTEKADKSLRDLLPLLPPQEARRLQRYQGTLEKLKNWVMQINARNKAFIQASLAHWRDLFSLLNPGETASPVYVPNGKRNPSRPQPVSLDRKV